MELLLHSVINGSLPVDEIVWIQVLESTNLRGYAIVDRTFGQNENLSNEFRHIFIFPNCQVQKNDWVSLNSGIEVYKKGLGRKGETIHRFYWGSAECVWNNNGKDSATLINFEVVKTVPVPAYP